MRGPGHGVDSLDELTYDVEEDGVLVRRQLERVVLARGPWATLLFLYDELDRGTGAFGAPKVSVTRFQKWRGGYRRHSAFPLANGAQARELAEVLARWSQRMAADGDDEDRREGERDGDELPDDGHGEGRG
jgi:hypothetical protein